MAPSGGFNSGCWKKMKRGETIKCPSRRDEAYLFSPLTDVRLIIRNNPAMFRSAEQERSQPSALFLTSRRLSKHTPSYNPWEC